MNRDEILLPQGEGAAKRRMRESSFAQLLPSPAAHLAMVGTLSLWERDARNQEGRVNSSSEAVLIQVLIQFMVILAAARLVGAIFRRIAQPQLCGEIAAGLILGPSLLGGIWPSAFKFVFPPTVVPFFSTVSRIGLVLLMFLIGLEFDFTHLRGKGRTVAAISLSGIAIPFMLGLLTARVIYPYVAVGIHPLAFSLFMATSLSITAMPVLGRIMLELNRNVDEYEGPDGTHRHQSWIRTWRDSQKRVFHARPDGGCDDVYDDSSSQTRCPQDCAGASPEPGWLMKRSAVQFNGIPGSSRTAVRTGKGERASGPLLLCPR